MATDLQIDPTLPVLIAGPTASGKSNLALQLAERDGRIIVNADALQVYSFRQDLSGNMFNAHGRSRFFSSEEESLDFLSDLLEIVEVVRMIVSLPVVHYLFVFKFMMLT